MFQTQRNYLDVPVLFILYFLLEVLFGCSNITIMKYKSNRLINTHKNGNSLCYFFLPIMHSKD